MAFETTDRRLEIRDRLVAHLLEQHTERTVPHSEIAHIIGVKTTSPNAIKYSAFKILSADHGIVFENVRGQGYRRIHAGEVHRVGTRARNRIRGFARRGASKIVSVIGANSNSMSPGERVKAHAEIAVLGMIKIAAGHSSMRKAEDVASKAYENRQKPPTVEAMARALLGAKANV